ncbi:Hypothetical predicted protein [Lecanosticta acicola]|uniref:Uncharacterized protein n=1 Tax=Lecanosticta acicola TaxID=111012 RepID=A0AAI8Z434_9PEZI|nr:Hypothetical predicted protein [Lecanosticta acicola]
MEEHEERESIHERSSTPGRKSSKSGRSLSDPPTHSTLQPSPTIKERTRDDASPSTPRPRPSPRRPDFLSRGLTLQLPPPRVTPTEASAPATLSPFAPPLSPRLDAHNTYMQQPSHSAQPSLPHSPATSLPRHSRGLDFSRACTTLHHSTLAESDPDSSPVITQRGVNIPGRKMSVGSMALDSPHAMGPGSYPWTQLPPHEKSTMSSSVGSVNMVGSESESSDSDEDASMGGDDAEDPIYATPQVHKLQNPNAPTPFNPPTTPAPNTGWGNGNHLSPAQASLMRTIKRTRLHKNGRRSRKSSSSASGSGYSSMASPRTTSPPPLRSIESAANSGYFTLANAARSRRESLAMGTDGVNLSSGDHSGDEATFTAPSTPGVVRRPVTRRGNLLPKTKGFARIRAALLEEAAPVDTEVRQEAETIRQVRERDGSVIGDLELPFERPQTGTAASSPNLLPAVPESAQEGFGRDLDGDKGLGFNFAAHVSRNSGGLDYWNRFEPSMRTPPPGFNRQSSSVMSDINMESPDFTQWRRPRARSSASDASEAFQPNANGAGNSVPAGMSDDMHLQKFKKRQREDDFDIATIKRRAVSPGMSAQNSPVLTNSPSAREINGAWGQPPDRRDKKDTPPVGEASVSSSHQVRAGSGGSSAGLPSGGNLVSQGKKLGLQPMADTNDGLMKMSIE